ncbi:hypothetical protein [Robertmurraya siralis]|uniref:hypothetical protein n=1 Tax=Robertmurraya siralis TaxID=77777 RepID=UPI0010F8581D|nr:hypothetical protein [Robertmurraya siralis]
MKRFFKFGCLGAIGLMVGLVIIGFIIGEDPNDTTTSVEVDDNKSEDAKEVTASQKDFYLNKTKPKIEELTGMYDKIWDEGWKPTFEALSNGNANIYNAYDNLKIVRDTYRDLSGVFKSIPVDDLGKEHQKLLESAFSDLRYAAVARQIAAEKAMEMIDTGNYSPSFMDEIESQIKSADSQMISGVASIAIVESELGIIENSN